MSIFETSNKERKQREVSSEEQQENEMLKMLENKINDTLTEDEKTLLKGKQSHIEVIAKHNGATAFYDAYRDGLAIRLIKPYFVTNCDFNTMKRFAKEVFEEWRPFEPRAIPYSLIIKDDFILTNLEQVPRRAFIYCSIANESRHPKELINTINDMPELEALYWYGELRRGLKEDKEYYNRARRALRILLGEA